MVFLLLLKLLENKLEILGMIQNRCHVPTLHHEYLKISKGKQLYVSYFLHLIGDNGGGLNL
jgi:hypothetical protein